MNPEMTIQDLLENGHAIIITMDGHGVGWQVSRPLQSSPLPIALLELAKKLYIDKLTRPPEPSQIIKPAL